MATISLAKLALTATATATVAIAVPATANAGVWPSFQTPSGNIMCWIAENTAACSIIDYTYADRQRPADCSPAEWPSTFWLSEGKPASVDCSDEPPGTYTGMRAHVALDYGQTKSVGVMSCASEPSSVTCTDASTGHSFRVSRDSYELGWPGSVTKRNLFVRAAVATAILSAAGCSVDSHGASPTTATAMSSTCPTTSEASHAVTYSSQVVLPFGDNINHLAPVAADTDGDLYVADDFKSQVLK